MDFATMYRQLEGVYLKATRKAWPDDAYIVCKEFEDETGFVFYCYVFVHEYEGEELQSTFVPSQLDIDSADWEWVIG